MKTKPITAAARRQIEIDRAAARRQIEIDRAVERARPYEVRLAERATRITAELERLVTAGKLARAELFAKIEKNGVGDLAYQVSWGYGIAEDLTAVEAARILAAIREHDIVAVLRYFRDDKMRRLASNHYRGTSSSDFSNAVLRLEGNVARAFVEKLDRWLEDLAEIRADAEVL